MSGYDYIYTVDDGVFDFDELLEFKVQHTLRGGSPKLVYWDVWDKIAKGTVSDIVPELAIIIENQVDRLLFLDEDDFDFDVYQMIGSAP